MAESQVDSFEFITQYLTAPVQLIILLVVVFALRKLIRARSVSDEPPTKVEEVLEPMKKRDFTVDELKEFNGVQGKRLLVAVNGKVFDVTRGRHFYGPGESYGIFAGRDASRGLATFSLDASVLKDEYDDLSELNVMQMDSLKEWEMQFTEKYDYIGKLLKPGEKHTQESETEDEDVVKPSQEKKDD